MRLPFITADYIINTLGKKSFADVEDSTFLIHQASNRIKHFINLEGIDWLKDENDGLSENQRQAIKDATVEYTLFFETTGYDFTNGSSSVNVLSSSFSESRQFDDSPINKTVIQILTKAGLIVSQTAKYINNQYSGTFYSGQGFYTFEPENLDIKALKRLLRANANDTQLQDYFKGSQGEPGQKGDTGDTGRGPTDAEIEQAVQEYLDIHKTSFRGEKGYKGDKGDKGDTPIIYYDDLKKQFTHFLRDDVDFLRLVEAAKGDKGDKGDPGDTGPQGIQGPRGERGERGASGGGASVTPSVIKQEIRNLFNSYHFVLPDINTLEITWARQHGARLTYDITLNHFDTKEKVIWWLQALKQQSTAIKEQWALKVSQLFDSKRTSNQPYTQFSKIILFQSASDHIESAANPMLGGFLANENNSGSPRSNQVITTSGRFWDSNAVRLALLYLINKYEWARTDDNPYWTKEFDWSGEIALRDVEYTQAEKDKLSTLNVAPMEGTPNNSDLVPFGVLKNFKETLPRQFVSINEFHNVASVFSALNNSYRFQEFSGINYDNQLKSFLDEVTLDNAEKTEVIDKIILSIPSKTEEYTFVIEPLKTKKYSQLVFISNKMMIFTISFDLANPNQLTLDVKDTLISGGFSSRDADSSNPKIPNFPAIDPLPKPEPPNIDPNFFSPPSDRNFINLNPVWFSNYKVSVKILTLVKPTSSITNRIGG